MGSDICGSLKIFRTATWSLTALSILCLNVSLNAQIVNGQMHGSNANGIVTVDTSAWKEPFKRGLRYQEQRQYEKAIEEYNEALKVGPGLWFITLQLGTAYYELKQYEKAIFYLTQAIKKNPDPPFRISAYQLRSFSYAGIEKYKEAMDDIAKAIGAIQLTPPTTIYCSRVWPPAILL